MNFPGGQCGKDQKGNDDDFCSHGPELRRLKLTLTLPEVYACEQRGYRRLRIESDFPSFLHKNLCKNNMT